MDSDRIKAKISDVEQQIAEFRRQAEQQLAALQGKLLALQELLEELEAGDESDGGVHDGSGSDSQ